MKTKRCRLVLFSVILFSLCFAQAFAQSGKGKARLNGLVVDEQGNPVGNAKVLLEFPQDQAIKHELTTNDKGEWAILGLGSGRWRVTVTAPGYQGSSTDPIVSQIEVNPRVTLTLKKLAAVDTSVVKDEAAMALIDKATQLFNDRSYDEAITLLQQFLTQFPTAYQTYILIGDCYREKGEYDSAVAAYNQAIEGAKTDEKMGKEITGKGLAGIGNCYLKQGNVESAQQFFKQSIDTYPDNEALAYNVGEIYFANQKLDEAIQYFTLATQIKPTWGLAYYKLGLAYVNKADYESAVVNLKKFLEIEPDSEMAGSVRSMLDYLEKIKK
jgi:Tfp pilus assembly protein PilF